MEYVRRFLGSTWTRVVILAVAIALAPLIFVYLGPIYGWFVRRGMQDGVQSAADRAARVLEESEGRLGEAESERLTSIAEEADVWLRVFDAEGREAFSDRHALGGQTYKRWLERVASDAPEPSHLEAYESQRRPILERREVARARQNDEASRCELAQEGRLHTCVHVRRVVSEGASPMYVYVQDASIRGVRELAGNRYPLLKLVLQVLGASLIVAVIVGWWTVRPVRRLHAQVLDRAAPPVSTNRVEVGASGEVGDLEEAFNDLLEALEERREATKAYMADIAHEVKNPVAAIKSAAERLESGELDRERADRIARVLSDSSDRLDQLVTRFLELARAEAGLPDERREPLELDELVERLVESYREDERYAELDFELELEPVEIEASPTHLETAVRNLLENGASFAESTVATTLRVEDGAVLEVRDDGPGIDPEDLPHVFDRFFSRRPGNEGTGLGLAMTRAVVEAHEGRIAVDSTPGEGTTFTIRLPDPSEA